MVTHRFHKPSNVGSNPISAILSWLLRRDTFLWLSSRNAWGLLFYKDEVNVMPYKARRGCSYPGWANLVVDVSTKGGSFLEGGKNFVRGPLFCNEHIHLQGKQYDKFERKYNHRERYDSRWDKVRNIYIKAHPLCEECLKENKSTIARIVHHIKPIEDGGDKYAFDNLMSVCDSCHQKIHTRLKKS